MTYPYISPLHSAYRTLSNGNGAVVTPSPMEDLPNGIKFATAWAGDPWVPSYTRDALVRWIADASGLLCGLALPPDTVRTRDVHQKLDPQTCVTCKTVNEYAGVEHLSPNGTYTCRGCKR